MKKRGVVFAAVMAAAVVFAACNKDEDENNDQLNNNDQTFVLQANVSNSAEVGAGTMATSKATNAAVKAFAQAMIAEHTQAQSDLKAVGNTVGITVKDSIDPAHVTLMTQLNAKTGRSFDSMYIYSQVADHQTAVSLFQSEVNSGQHTQVKGYASTYLPRIQMHLTRADSIARAYFPR